MASIGRIEPYEESVEPWPSAEVKDAPHVEERKQIWNKKLITIKLHYILFFGGQAAVLPYIPLLAKQLGITASALGIVYGALPFLAFVITPFLCNLADRYRCLTLALTVAIAFTLLSYGGIAFIPPLRGDVGEVSGSIHCGINGSYLDLNGVNVNNECQYAKAQPKCRCKAQECRSSEETSSNISDLTCNSSNNDVQFSFNIQNSVMIISSTWNENYRNVPKTCDYPVNISCSVLCSDLDPCVTPEETELDRRVFRSEQYWIFLVLMLVSWISAATVVSLADSLCYQILDTQPELYGHQRLWGTVGWGVIGTICGYWLNTTSDASQAIDYKPAYYLMAAMMGADALMISQMSYRQVIQEKSHSSRQELLKVIKDFRVIWFLIEVLVIGMLTGLLWTYSFWIFQGMGSSLLVLGLSVAVQSFLGELPFFYFSGKIIDTIGHFPCLGLSFLSYALRYVAYNFIREPWLILPLELLHGPGYSLFYSAMTSFASRVSPEGLEASLQGITIGTFENLGAPLGGLFGGFVIDFLGERKTFLSAGVLALCFGGLYVLVHLVYLRKRERL